jgi:hypothetical protein
MFEDTLIVESKNGFHFYFDSSVFKLRSTAKKGSGSSIIKYIDFRGEGGLIFVNSSSEIASYKVICDSPPTTDISEIKEILPEYGEVIVLPTEKSGFFNLEDETDREIAEIKGGNKQPLEEVLKLLGKVSSNCSRDEWLSLMASAYNLIDTNPERLKSHLRAWSIDGATEEHPYDEAGFTIAWNEIHSGKFGKAFKGGTLVKKYNETVTEGRVEAQEEKYERYMNLIANAETIEEVKGLFKDSDWKDEPICSPEQQKVLPAICADRCRDINKALGIKTKIAVALFKPLILIKEVKTKVVLDGIEAYYHNNQFCITCEDKIIENIYRASLGVVAVGLDQHPEDFIAHVSSTARLIQGVRKATDYMAKEEVTFKTSKSSNPSEFDYLEVLTNPLYVTCEPPSRKDIIEDFFENIWKGKAEEIIKIIGLTMRFNETKLNKIHVVAPSNTGKTTFLENVGFQTIHMKRLVQALNADKGIGKNVIDGLKASGFLLIDEANDPLTQEIKNIDNYIQLDQFGQGGTQEVKLHFTCLTSTHKTAVRGMSDEMYNRLMLVHLTRDEIDYTIDKSELFISETNVYTKAITQQVRWLLKDALTNPKYNKEDLYQLQDKYRLELNSDVSEMLTEISEHVVNEYKSLAGESGDIILRDENYYIKRKTDLVQAVEDRLGEYSNIDTGKYSDELISHFISGNTKNFKVNGSSVKYYQMTLKKYYKDFNSDEAKHLMLLDMFEDLEIADL